MNRTMIFLYKQSETQNSLKYIPDSKVLKNVLKNISFFCIKLLKKDIFALPINISKNAYL